MIRDPRIDPAPADVDILALARSALDERAARLDAWHNRPPVAAAFVQSPALSFRGFVEAGGRDPRHDPAPGDEVGVKLPRSHRILAVDRVARVGDVIRVHGRAIERDLGTRGWCERVGPFEASLSHWRDANAARSVFVVAALAPTRPPAPPARSHPEAGGGDGSPGNTIAALARPPDRGVAPTSCEADQSAPEMLPSYARGDARSTGEVVGGLTSARASRRV